MILALKNYMHQVVNVIGSRMHGTLTKRQLLNLQRIDIWQYRRNVVGAFLGYNPRDTLLLRASNDPILSGGLKQQ